MKKLKVSNIISNVKSWGIKILSTLFNFIEIKRATLKLHRNRDLRVIETSRGYVIGPLSGDLLNSAICHIRPKVALGRNVFKLNWIGEDYYISCTCVHPVPPPKISKEYVKKLDPYCNRLFIKNAVSTHLSILPLSSNLLYDRISKSTNYDDIDDEFEEESFKGIIVVSKNNKRIKMRFTEEQLSYFPIIEINDYEANNDFLQGGNIGYSSAYRRFLIPIDSGKEDTYYWVNGSENLLIQELRKLNYSIYIDEFGRTMELGGIVNEFPQPWIFHQPKNIKMSNIRNGRCLLICDDKAILSPIYDSCSPLDDRYNRFVSKLSLVGNDSDFMMRLSSEQYDEHENFFQAFRLDDKIEDYFPMDLRGHYYSKFGVLWLFIRNCSTERVMIYTANNKEEEFVVVNPSSTIVLYRGGKSTHHEEQYKLRNHPIPDINKEGLFKYI